MGGFTALGVATDFAEIYDPSLYTSEAVGRLTRKRAGHSATRLPDSRVLIAGGWGTSGFETTTELYDPKAGGFTAGPEMNAARTLHVAQSLTDGSVLLAGGYQGGAFCTAAVQRFVSSGQ